MNAVIVLLLFTPHIAYRVCSSLSDAAADLGQVKSFSILIVTEKNGSVIREVAPPGL